MADGKLIKDLSVISKASDDCDLIIEDDSPKTMRIKLGDLKDYINQEIQTQIASINNDLSDLSEVHVLSASSSYNLNDFTDYGVYYFATNSEIANIPVGSNGWLVVLTDNGLSRVKQLWFRFETVNSNDFSTYVRTYGSNTWGNWQRYAMDSQIETINSNLSELNTFLDDTGWIDLELLNGAEPANHNYGGRASLSYRRIGKHVFVAGGISLSDFSSSTQIASIPSGYRPATNHYYLCTLNGSNIIRAYINSSGNFVIEWARSISDGSWVSSLTWCDLSTDWWID